MTKIDATKIYENLKFGRIKFEEEKNCVQVLEIMSDWKKGTLSAICTAIGVSESTFYKWLKISEMLRECYSLGKMFARENWEEDGRALQWEVTEKGTSNHRFEYWRMIGWSRFGVGKNSRVRLELDEEGTPNQHYNELIKQAAQGDFTAGEIKQLMEAINVGLNAHQVFKLQQEVDELKGMLEKKETNKNADHSRPVK